MYHVEVNNDRVFTVRWNLKSLRRAVSPKHYVNQRWHLQMAIRQKIEEAQCRHNNHVQMASIVAMMTGP